ncbi:MAG: hypothetical protein ACRECE_05580 [Xanthobacteraceae bacterium]
MAILNPDHLLEQAEKLIAPPPHGPPRQVDIRRAISAAYYSVFHATLAANEYVGAAHKWANRYTLAYRSIDHQKVREVCAKAKLAHVPREISLYAPSDGFDPEIRDLASALHELQQKRHDADYNPSIRVRTSDARLAISAARRVLDRLQAANSASREAFLGLLLFKVR